MTITLQPDQEKLVAKALRTGAYRDTNHAIERALEVLLTEEDTEEVSDRIKRAFAQFEGGEFYTAEQSRANMARRKADWLQERQQP